MSLSIHNPVGRECVCALQETSVQFQICNEGFSQDPSWGIEFCGNKLPNGGYCGHDRACHSPAVSEPMVSISLDVADFFAEIGRLTLAGLKHQTGDTIEKARKYQAEMESAIASTSPAGGEGE